MGWPRIGFLLRDLPACLIGFGDRNPALAAGPHRSALQHGLDQYSKLIKREMTQVTGFVQQCFVSSRRSIANCHGNRVRRCSGDLSGSFSFRPQRRWGELGCACGRLGSVRQPPALRVLYGQKSGNAWVPAFWRLYSGDRSNPAFNLDERRIGPAFVVPGQSRRG